MKTIVLWNSDAVAAGDAPDLSVGVDSAVLRHGEPLFVDIERPCRSLVCPAVRIDRLGTHIPLRVARSYADAMAAYHLLMPENAADARRAIWGLSDRTFAPGEFMPLADGAVTLTASAYAIGDKPSTSASVIFDTGTVGAAIAAVSAFCTLRTGDVLVFADHGINVGAATVGTFVDASVDTTPSLHLKIK